MNRVPIVFPIRFATASGAVQTTTRELAREGVFIRCLEPPAPGTPVRLKLYLPGSREPAQASALVRELAGPGAEPGFWAHFVEVPRRDRTLVEDTIARRERASQATPIGAVAVQPEELEDLDEDPRRAFRRYESRFAVRFSTVQDFVLEYAANISAGGVFVHTQDPPPLKTVVSIEMQLPGADAPVPAKGIVVHRVTAEDAEQRGTLPGMGVQFVEADDAFRESIDAAIEHILEAG
ncbi:MAG TPA: TIGR02266 family protein [Myxococcales bacterium]|nr:TIGR02266 family protein [Myxococcales bacterium]